MNDDTPSSATRDDQAPDDGTDEPEVDATAGRRPAGGAGTDAPDTVYDLVPTSLAPGDPEPPPHEVAVYPEMTPEAYEAFLADIRAHGVQVPIVMLDGKVLDGRHRLRAARELGLPVPCIRVVWTASPARLVISLNGHRRHDTPSQLAMTAAKLLGPFEAEARARQATSTGGRARRLRADQRSPCGRSRDRAAAAVGVSPRSVQAAATVQKLGIPGLQALVEQGEVSVSAAEPVARLSVAEQEAIVAAPPPERLIRLRAAPLQRRRKDQAAPPTDADATPAPAAMAVAEPGLPDGTAETMAQPTSAARPRPEEPADDAERAWLYGLPARLTAARSRRFDEEALLWRRLAPYLEAIREAVPLPRSAAARTRAAENGPSGPLAQLLAMRSPEFWTKCPACANPGRGPAATTCRCGGVGFLACRSDDLPPGAGAS
jgi:hypothetical protein